jgi:hypothetical protein
MTDRKQARTVGGRRMFLECGGARGAAAKNVPAAFHAANQAGVTMPSPVNLALIEPEPMTAGAWNFFAAFDDLHLLNTRRTSVTISDDPPAAVHVAKRINLTLLSSNLPLFQALSGGVIQVRCAGKLAVSLSSTPNYHYRIPTNLRDKAAYIVPSKLNR